MKRHLLITAFLALAALGVVLGWSLGGLWTPARSDDANQLFRVGPGESLRSVAHRLDAEQLLPDRALFGPGVLVAFARMLGLDRDVKSGEYDLAPSMTPLQILDLLVSGAVKTHAVTLPEGLRLDEIAERLEAAGITDADSFVKKGRDTEFVRSLGLEAETVEGYLYPETYRFRRDTPAEEVLREMLKLFQASFADADREQVATSGMSLHQVVTLASIVEKETAAGAERPRIAAVFHNRLRRGMRLQSDPTVIYGLIYTYGEFNGNIRSRDLRTDNAYYTYTRSGLPPGPIASPSMASIRAVLNPEKVGYLYFVSKNDGTHQFSATLAEHNRAVQQYQKRRRRKNRN